MLHSADPLPSRPRRIASCLALGCLLWLALPASAQEPASPRSTPRAAMRGYLVEARANDFDAAATYLDLSRVSDPAEGPRLARHLKFVLDQKLWVDLEALSDEPEGDPTDGMPRGDRVGTIEVDGEAVPISLQRSARDGEWRIAPLTVASIDRLYAEYGLGPLGEVLPPPMFVQVGELALWQWSALLALVVVAYVLGSLLVSLGLRAGRRLARRADSQLGEELLQRAAGPLTIVVMIALINLGSLPLGLSLPARVLLSGASKLITLFAFAWLAVRAVDVASYAMERRILERADTTVLTVIPVGRRVAKVFLMVIAVLAALQNLGFNVISIIAGLGVVGIGVALAAQKTFENFFGTISILIDQPLRRGDFCRFGDQVGTVEDIGLRSTRIRTLDRTLITIPNAEFSNLRLENFGARDRIRLCCVLGLRYETSADQMRHVLVGLKKLLVAHPRVTDDPCRVRFVGFGAHSLDLEIFAYVDTNDWNEFLSIREDLLLRVIDVVEASGTGFALPSQTLYLGRDAGLDPERTQAALEEVRAWREQRRLPLPDPDPEAVAALDGTLPYPPEGSVSRPAK